MRYEVQLNCKGENERLGVVEADGDPDAHDKAKAWARSLEAPLDDAWLIVKNADGRFKTFAMAANLSATVMDWADIVEAMDADAPKPGKRGLYKKESIIEI